MDTYVTQILAELQLAKNEGTGQSNWPSCKKSRTARPLEGGEVLLRFLVRGSCFISGVSPLCVFFNIFPAETVKRYMGVVLKPV